MEDRKGLPNKRIEYLSKCFDVLCAHGLENTSLIMMAEACEVTNGALLYYFDTKDNIIIEATEYCMSKVEDDFMQRAPKDFNDIERFLKEMPYITAKVHGDKYRLMYQVYSSPKYKEYGKRFFEDVNIRYNHYAKLLSAKLKMPTDYIQGMIYIFVRACVHFALFEDEEYLLLQLNAIRESLKAYMMERRNKQ